MASRGIVNRPDEQEAADESAEPGEIIGYYVYLASGEVRRVSPADAMDISLDAVQFTWHGSAVDRFRRSDVFSCSQGHPASPMVG